MKSKAILTAVLVAFVVVSIAFAIVKEVRKAPPSEETNLVATTSQDAPAAAQSAPEKVVVYYFRGNARCPTCMKLEAYSREAVQTGFKQALNDKRLEFRVVNVEEPGNGHYVDEYDLYTKSVVVVKMKGNERVRWTNLSRIWDLVGSKDEFVEYVQDAVESYLGEA